MAYAFTKDVSGLDMSKKMRIDFDSWNKTISGRIKKGLGYIDSKVFHMYHLRPGKKNYGSYNLLLKILNYNPQTDLEDKDGLMYIGQNKLLLRFLNWQFFLQRKQGILGDMNIFLIFSIWNFLKYLTGLDRSP